MFAPPPELAQGVQGLLCLPLGVLQVREDRIPETGEPLWEAVGITLEFLKKINVRAFSLEACLNHVGELGVPGQLPPR